MNMVNQDNMTYWLTHRKYEQMSHSLSAQTLCVMAHEGQFRKHSKLPYFVHPFRVADALNNNFNGYCKFIELNNGLEKAERFCCIFDSVILPAAYLHDVPEDTEIKDLAMYGFTPEICNMVKNLTKVKPQSEFVYMSQLGIFDKCIKLEDTIDNIMSCFDACTPMSFIKYYVYKKQQTVEFLKGVNDERYNMLLSMFETLTQVFKRNPNAKLFGDTKDHDILWHQEAFQC